MAIPEERLKSLLAYCRIEEPTEEERLTLNQAYDSAVAYLDGAGVTEPQAGTPRRGQYDMCVNYLVLDAFDTRVETITGTITNENPAFRRLINQLKLTEPVSDSDTGGEDDV